MIRTCPKCGDYYADALLAFCLVDGTPLISVAPASESWSEGARAIEKKENALKKQKRRLKWRRIVMSAMAITTMVVCVMAINSFIYIETSQPEAALPVPSTPAIVPDVVTASAATPTTPDEPTPTPMPKKALTPTPTPTPTPEKLLKCSDADQSRESKIVDRLWRQNIESDRIKIIREYFPSGLKGVSAGFRVIESRTTFSKACQAAVVIVKYEWQITAPTIKTRPIPKEKKFDCAKTGGTWLCKVI